MESRINVSSLRFRIWCDFIEAVATQNIGRRNQSKISRGRSSFECIERVKEDLNVNGPGLIVSCASKST